MLVDGFGDCPIMCALPVWIVQVFVGDCCAFGIDLTPLDGEGCVNGDYQAVVRVHGIH